MESIPSITFKVVRNLEFLLEISVAPIAQKANIPITNNGQYQPIPICLLRDNITYISV